MYIINSDTEVMISVNKTLHYWSLRNPVCTGKIVIPKLKNEESYIVDGQHEPLVSASLFYEAQDVLDGRKRKI